MLNDSQTVSSKSFLTHFHYTVLPKFVNVSKIFCVFYLLLVRQIGDCHVHTVLLTNVNNTS